MALSIIGYILLCLAMVGGLLLTPLGLPGNWIIVGCGVAHGFVTGWSKFGWPFVALLVAAAFAGEIIEALSAAIGAKKYGASTGAMVAAIVGSIVGLSLGSGIMPIVGTIVGGFAGAFLGAFLYEYSRLNDRRQALRAGVGAFLGRTAAVIAKESIGSIMVGAIVYQLLT
jgi:hypothetical protein